MIRFNCPIGDQLAESGRRRAIDDPNQVEGERQRPYAILVNIRFSSPFSVNYPVRSSVKWLLFTLINWWVVHSLCFHYPSPLPVHSLSLLIILEWFVRSIKMNLHYDLRYDLRYDLQLDHIAIWFRFDHSTRMIPDLIPDTSGCFQFTTNCPRPVANPSNVSTNRSIASCNSRCLLIAHTLTCNQPNLTGRLFAFYQSTWSEEPAPRDHLDPSVLVCSWDS